MKPVNESYLIACKSWIAGYLKLIMIVANPGLRRQFFEKKRRNKNSSDATCSHCLGNLWGQSLHKMKNDDGAHTNCKCGGAPQSSSYSCWLWICLTLLNTRQSQTMAYIIETVSLNACKMSGSLGQQGWLARLVGLAESVGFNVLCTLLWPAEHSGR